MVNFFNLKSLQNYTLLKGANLKEIELKLYCEKLEKLPIFLKLLIRLLLPLLRSRLFRGNLGSKINILNQINGLLLGNLRLIEKSSYHPSDPRSSHTLEVDKNNFIEDFIYDEIIIGSGPGGCIAALNSIKKNSKVLLVEKGNYFESESIVHHSLLQTKMQFKNEGMNFMWGIPPVIYAEGETLGGVVK